MPDLVTGAWGEPLCAVSPNDLAADPGAALAAAYRVAAGETRLDTASSDLAAEAVITLPPGEYVITNPGTLLSGAKVGGRRTRGLILQGAGRHTTTIRFAPTAPGYLIDNQDKWSRVTIRDISFVGDNADASFMRSHADGGPQSLTFRDVTWFGTWDYGLHLTGTDVNSEFLFTGCKARGTYGHAWLYSDNPQALNHTLLACDLEISQGDGIHYAQGGNLNAWGGSWISGYNNPDGTGSLIRMSTRTGAPGVCRALIQGVRVEHRSDHTQLIDCAWDSGHVTFRDVHDSAYQAAQETAPTVVRAVFRGLNPVVTFDACRLSGKHEYTCDGQNDDYRRLVTYRDSIIEHHTRAADFITTTLAAGVSTRDGARTPALFDRCRPGIAVATLSSREQFDGTVNAHLAEAAELTERTVTMRGSFGEIPGTGTIVVKLPLNAIITGVRTYAPAGSAAGSNTAWKHTLTDGDGTVIADLGSGAAMSAGYNITATPWHVCSTDNRRTLTLTPSNTTGTGDAGLFLVTYLA